MGGLKFAPNGVQDAHSDRRYAIRIHASALRGRSIPSGFLYVRMMWAGLK